MADTFFEFRAVGGTPAIVRLYPRADISVEYYESDSNTQVVDQEPKNTGRWRAALEFGVPPGDWVLIAYAADGSVVADERYTVTFETLETINFPWSEAKPLNVAEITSAISTLLDAATIEYVSPYNEQTSELTLAQRCDYKDGTVIGPLRWEIDNEAVDAGDTIRFGAALNRPFLESASDQKINATGTVVDEAGTLYAVVELSKEEHTDRLPGTDWRWELEHIDGDGNVSPLYSDQKMILKPSRGN